MIKYTILKQGGSIRIGSLIKSIRFPGGEVGVKLQQQVTGADTVEVYAQLNNAEDIMELLLTVDAIRRQKPDVTLTLKMPYIPYARQDRVCDHGEPLSMAVFAQLINSCNFAKVFVIDPHSDVAPALINNCIVREQVDIFRNIKVRWTDTVIVAPDAGAYKKSFKFAQAVGAHSVLSCNKVRDMATGQILRTELMGVPAAGLTYLILDDICDGGRTFIELAALFEGYDIAGLELAVTHGIFSKGVEVVEKHFSRVYTTNSFHGESLFLYETSSPKFTVLEV